MKFSRTLMQMHQIIASLTLSFNLLSCSCQSEYTYSDFSNTYDPYLSTYALHFYEDVVEDRGHTEGRGISLAPRIVDNFDNEKDGVDT
jgi:hypothetical protein